MDEQRKYAILLAATILAARKLNESGIKPWAVHVAITDAIDKAKLLLEKTSGGQRNQIHPHPHAKNLPVDRMFLPLNQSETKRIFGL